MWRVRKQRSPSCPFPGRQNIENPERHRRAFVRESVEVTRKCIQRVCQADDCHTRWMHFRVTSTDSQRGVVALDERTARALEMLTRPALVIRESASRKRHLSFRDPEKTFN